MTTCIYCGHSNSKWNFGIGNYKEKCSSCQKEIECWGFRTNQYQLDIHCYYVDIDEVTRYRWYMKKEYSEIGSTVLPAVFVGSHIPYLKLKKLKPYL